MKNEVILNPDCVLWGFRWRVTEGKGFVNIQRTAAAGPPKYRIARRLRSDVWRGLYAPMAAQASPQDQAKLLYELTRERAKKTQFGTLSIQGQPNQMQS
jgi:hypothetical protein